MFFISVIIAGVFLIKADASADFVRKLIHRLAGERSDEIIPVTGVTIQNVAKGILGVAFFQFVTAGIVFLLASVPLADFGPLLSWFLPFFNCRRHCHRTVIIYLFSVKELMPAILWTIPLLVIALSDNVLKPLLMGKGSSVPMLVIFLGAIGGFIFSGLIGCSPGPWFFQQVTNLNGVLDRRRAEVTEIPISGIGSVSRNCKRKNCIGYETLALEVKDEKRAQSFVDNEDENSEDSRERRMEPG